MVPIYTPLDGVVSSSNVNDNVHLISPVYFCPGNPRNTLSTTSLVQYCGYDSAIVDTNRYLEITDMQQCTSQLTFDVCNDLDHVHLSILMMKPIKLEPPIIAATSLRQSPRLSMKATSPLTTLIHTNDLIDPVPPVAITTNILTVDGDPDICARTHRMDNTSTYTIPDQSQETSLPFDLMDDSNIVATIPRSVMAKIAAYSVLLEPQTSPFKMLQSKR